MEVSNTEANPVPTYETNVNRDSFGRSRVSNINNIFESTHVNSEQTEFWDFKLLGGGAKTYVPQKSQIELTVGTASGDLAMRQTMNYFHYAAGQSMIIRFTGVLGAGKASVQKGFGYVDDNNGLMFRTTDTTFEVVTRSDTSGVVVDTAISQASFNGDKLDGTGDSGFTIDLDQTQIFEINYQWLGVGDAKFYVHINGIQILLHTFHNANINNTVYMRTPHLPIRYGVRNTGITASATTVTQICTQIANEGNAIVGDTVSSVDRDIDVKALNTTDFRPVISMRVKAGESAIIVPTSIGTLVKTSDDIIVHIYVDAVITGGTWVSDSQFVEKDVSATAVSGGTKIGSYYISKQGRSADQLLDSKFRLGEYIDGTKQTITVAMKSVATNANVLASISFKELF